MTCKGCYAIKPQKTNKQTNNTHICIIVHVYVQPEVEKFIVSQLC